MIEVFLTDESYYFTDGFGTHNYFHVKKDDISWTIYNEYQQSYLMLIYLFSVLRKENIKHFVLYNNSRLVEELNGQIKPISTWGEGALLYLYRNSLPYFVDYTFRKKSLEDLTEKINDGKRRLSEHDQKRSSPKSVIDSILHKRIRRFKNGR